MNNWKPGPVVTAVFAAELIGLWAVASLKYFYGIEIDPVDVRVNMLLFTVAAAWWTEHWTRL